MDGVSGLCRKEGCSGGHLACNLWRHVRYGRDF